MGPDGQETDIEHIPVNTRKGSAYLVCVTKANVPDSLVTYLVDVFNAEIDAADTYPHDEHMTADVFRDYWFGYHCVLLIAESPSLQERNWSVALLGTNYVFILSIFSPKTYSTD